MRSRPPPRLPRASTARVAALLACGVAITAPRAHGDDVWQFRTFTSRDGLAHDVVRDVLEAPDGSIWIATMGGITRYDPRACRYETPAASRGLEAMALAQSDDGTLWIATQGAGVVELRRGRWIRHTSRTGLPSDEITSVIVDRRGRVWATPTTGGIAVYEGGRWRLFGPRDGLTPGAVGRCTEVASGEILCGTYDRPQLQRYDGARWSPIPIAVDRPRRFYVHAVAEGPDRRLWLATKGAGVIEGRPLAAGGLAWTVHDTTGGLPSNRVQAVRPLPDGAIWAATTAGASRWDGARWRSFSRKEGLGANLIFAITRASDGALWIATLGGGVTRYGNSRWRHEVAPLPSANLTGGLLLATDGALWVGTDRGAARQLGGGRWETLVSGDAAMDYVNHMVEAPDRSVWLATRAGVRRWSAGRWTGFPADATGRRGPRHATVARLAVERDGAQVRIWAATARGVSVFDGAAWRGYGVRDGLPAATVNAVLVTRGGRVWAATDNGVAELVGDRWRAHLSPDPPSRTNRVYSLVEDASGQLWASGLESVSRLRGDRWQRVPPDEWLPAGIYSRFMMTTADGSSWFAVRGLGVRRERDGLWASLTSADGLAGDTVRDVAQAADGELLFATLGGGLSRYRPGTAPPQTWIGAAPSTVVGGEQVVFSFRGQDALKDTPAAALSYSFRLDGGPWSRFSRATTATLGALRTGEHLFEVRALDRDLNVDLSPAAHRFRVLPPWYKQPWVLALVALCVGVLLYATVRNLRAAAREREAVRKEHAVVEQRRHFVRLASHELRKPLARLAHRAELIALPETLADQQQLTRHAGAMAEDCGRLTRLVDGLLHQAKVQEGLQLALQPGDLRQTVRAVVERFISEQPAAEAQGAPALRLGDDPVVVRHDAHYVELALRNLLDNAQKYAPPLGAVSLELTRDAQRAELVVRDGGPGIAPELRAVLFEAFARGRTAPEHAGFGLGLSFARDIARAHGGDLALLDEPPPGAAFRFTLPLAEG